MITKNRMTGKDEGNFKGYNWRLNGYMGFDIENENGSKIHSFQPYAGNNLMNYDRKTIRLKLLAMIRYLINKEIKK